MLTFMKKNKQNSFKIGACADGKIIPLEKVNDPVFANKMMGDGIAIHVQSDTIVSPVDGTVTLIAETLHAFGFTTKEGVEIMVHVGLETVNLQGEGFTALVKAGDVVKKGTPILRLDLDFMKEKNISLVTPTIVLNHQDYPIVNFSTDANILAGEDLLQIKKG